MQGGHLDRHEGTGGGRRRRERDLLGRSRVLGDARGDLGGRRGQLVTGWEVGALHLGLGQGPGQGAHRPGDEGAGSGLPPAGRTVLGDGDAVDALDLLPALAAGPTHELADAPVAPVVDGRVPRPAGGGGG